MERVFFLRMDHGEDLIGSLQKFLVEKRIESCTALFLGALRDGRAVTGPVEPLVPPSPHFESYESAWEVMGMATVHPSPEGLKMHIHSALGRGREALLGCIRQRAEVYLVVEVVLFEICGLGAERVWDGEMQLFLPKLKERL